MVRTAATLATLVLWSFAFLHAQTGKRKALIIGNNEYIGNTGFSKLDRGPINDANAIRQALITVGFDKSDITLVYDLTYRDFLIALADFRSKLNSNDSALVYFSGHGFSIDGSDFLAPVDFALGNTKEATRQRSIALTQIINFLSITKNRVVILDACRTDSPLLKQMTKDSSGVNLGTLVATQGTGTLVAYATSAGKASNGRSPSGLSFYTYHLVNSLAARPKDMLTALNMAKDRTISASKQAQVPAIYDEMQGSFSLLQPGAPGPTAIGGQSDAGAPTSARRTLNLPKILRVCMGTCVTKNDQNFATWIFNGKPQGRGTWSKSNSIAILTIRQFDSERVLIHDENPPESSEAGLTADYEGTIQGNRIEGTVTLSWFRFSTSNHTITWPWYAVIVQ
jgi:Caspase domain